MLAGAPKQYVWTPQPGQSDSLTLFLDDGIVEVMKQAHIPLELSSPIFDLAGLYSPLVLLTEVPTYGQEESGSASRTVFYQHLDIIHLGQLLEKLNQHEPGWTIQGRAVVSPADSTLGLDTVRALIVDSKQPERLAEPELEPESEPVAVEQTREKAPINVRSLLWGAMGFVLGIGAMALWNRL